MLVANSNLSGVTMSIFGKAILCLNLLFAGAYLGTAVHAQRPPEIDTTGAAYLLVNINPYDIVPKVEVTQMPEIRVPPSGCQNRQNFQTGIGRSIAGPLMVTYLHLPQQTTATLADAAGSHSMNLGAAGQVKTAIFLQPNQRLEFDSEIMYSGCRPD